MNLAELLSLLRLRVERTLMKRGITRVGNGLKDD